MNVAHSHADFICFNLCFTPVIIPLFGLIKKVPKILYSLLFQYLYRASFIVLYYDQQMHNYFTNYRPALTCFDTIVSSSGSWLLVPCQVTQICKIQLLVIHFKIISHGFYAHFATNRTILIF